jgi:hypothetical protein
MPVSDSFSILAIGSLGLWYVNSRICIYRSFFDVHADQILIPVSQDIERTCDRKYLHMSVVPCLA